MNFVSGVLGNIIANILFWFGLGIVVWFVTGLSRRKFLHFFGLRDGVSLTVYLSNLWNVSALPPPFTPKQGHAGATISMHEFRAAQAIARLFGGAPGRLPELVSGLVDGVWVRRTVEPHIEVSSDVAAQKFISTAAIIVGGGTRNPARANVVAAGLPYLVFDYEQAGSGQVGGNEGKVVICRGSKIGEVVSQKLNLAIVEKIYDADRDATIFCCNGLRGDSSWGAVEYLCRHWRSLERKYGGRGFALCLGFPDQDSYMETYVEPRRLLSIPD